MSDVLVKYGADLEAKTDEGASILHIAVQGNHPKFILHLIEKYQVSLYDTDYQGKNAVHRGAYFGSDSALELLLTLDKAGIFPNSRDDNRNSPLHFAVVSGMTKVVRLLLARKADPYALDMKGRSPLMMAKSLQLWHIVELINAPVWKLLIGFRPPMKKNDGGFVAFSLYFTLFTALSIFTLCQSWSVFYIFLITSEFLIYSLIRMKNPGYLPNSSHTLSVPTTQELLASTSASMVCISCHCRHTNRSKHCVACGRCVERFDHHCQWIGNCVGAKNIGIFYCFLWITEMNLMVSVYMNVVNIWGKNELEVWFLLISICVIVLTGLFFIGLGKLILTQTFNLLYGKTTNERFSRSSKSGKETLQCSLRNCFDMCCNYRAPSPASKPNSLTTPLITA